ncbi:MAG: hypothetical protein KUG73_14745, partial [Pseudomonadales bacterium]|nr:hypothetical protein [Pseudomonadales bacterium]
SMGGLIAIEIARRLRSAGSRVEAVFLLDTYIPTETNKVNDVDFIVEKLGAIIDVDRATVNALSAEARVEFVIDSLISSGALPVDISRDELASRVSVFLAHQHAFEQYKMDDYDGRLIHWCATEGATENTTGNDKQLDTKQGTQPRAKSDTLWTSLCTKVDQRYIKTDHEGVLQVPYAGEIALAINKIIKN